MKLTFIGAAHEVTGSCTLLSASGKQILIDCGMEQGANTYENAAIPISPHEIDAIFLTHAHIDHSGMIPALVEKGYSGPIYMTGATARLCNIMLFDSANIQEQEAEWRNRKAKRNGTAPYEPLYTIKSVEETIKLFKPFAYNESFSPLDGVSAKFIDAGHLLGSSSIHLEITEGGKTESLLFSGDLGNVDRPLIKNPEKPPYADFCMIESTYGDRVHGERPDYETQLVAIMKDTFSKGGNLVIPSFAIGRTQELLYLFGKIKAKHLLPEYENFPVYVDSPLASEATKIYKDGLFDYYDEETLALIKEGKNPIGFQGLNLSVTKEESMAINEDITPKVIISASGMCEAGRIRHHLKHNLWRSEATILFVGYQSEGTLGRRLLNGAKTVNLFGEEVSVNAKIENLMGISGHADKDMLLSWLSSMEKLPKIVFVNHGEDSVCDYFAENIQNKLGVRAIAPYSGDEFDLSEGRFSKRGTIVKAEKKKSGKNRADMVYDALLSAAANLKRVAELSRGLTNKELSKFTDQINALADRYVRKGKDTKKK